MTKLDPLVLNVAKQNRARALDELRRAEAGDAPGITAWEIEMLRDKVREIDALIREHEDATN